MTTHPAPDPRLVVELAALGLARAAPDELAVLDETAAEYFADPQDALRSGAPDRAMGSGIDVVMLTPYLLAAAQVVLPVLAAIVGETVKGVAVQVLTERVRAFFKRGPQHAPGPAALTGEQAGAVYRGVVDRCLAAGLSPDAAAQVARTTVESLHVRS